MTPLRRSSGYPDEQLSTGKGHDGQDEGRKSHSRPADLSPTRGRASVTAQISQVAVVGAGYMGGGIAQVLAMAGLHVVIVDAAPDITQRHLERLRREAEEFESQGLFDPGSADLVRKNLRAADSLPEAVAEADLVEEAVLEQPEIKGPVLRSIEEAARPDAVIGSNTSTIPIGGLAANLQHAERFLG